MTMSQPLRRGVAIACAAALLAWPVGAAATGGALGPQIIKSAACTGKSTKAAPTPKPGQTLKPGEGGVRPAGNSSGSSKVTGCSDIEEELAGFKAAIEALEEPAAVILFALLPLVLLVGAGMTMLGQPKGWRIMGVGAAMAVFVASVGGIAA
jgi:hypothetical protein